MPTTTTEGSADAKKVQEVSKASDMTSIDSELLAIEPSLSQLIASFDYSTPVDPSKPDSTCAFNRSFQHQDWVDGESAVQAGKTPEEAGFNERFHLIENDLDSIKADLNKLGACLADLRKTTANCMQEIRTQLRKLLAASATSTGLSKIPMPIDTKLAYDAYVGPADILGQSMNLWRTEDGRMLAIPLVPVSTYSWKQPGLFRAGALLALEAEHPEIDEQLGKHLTVGEAVREFGDLRADGITFREMVSILSPTSEYKSLTTLSHAVAEREGAALRSNNRAGTTLLSALGVDTESGTAAMASVQHLPVISEKVKNALTAAKINTISQLAKISPAELTRILESVNVPAAQTEAARLTGLAATLVGIG
jgi:hypothetical protein